MKTKEFPLSGIVSEAELAKKLGVSARVLAAVLKHASAMYREIEIKKKDGTPRILRAPADNLKIIQRTVLDKILVASALPGCAFGFGRGKGIVENALLHAANPYLLNVDIKDFFPSVHFTRVQKIFTRLGATKDIASALTRLTTFEHSLPQGAPTSPYLATLALSTLDRRLMQLCASNRLTYSRYFDDITISGGERAHKIVEVVEQIINEEGYKMHRGAGKFRLSGPDDEKFVTGIIIRNGVLEAPKIKEILSYLCLLQSEGIKALKDDNLLKERTSLRGKINFINQIDKNIGLHRRWKQHYADCPTY